MTTLTLTARETETRSAIQCPRGQLHFTSYPQDHKHNAKLSLRKWLSANGVPSTYAARLSFAELENAWNDTTDTALDTLRNSQSTAGSASSTATYDNTFQQEAQSNMTAHSTSDVATAANLLAEALANMQTKAPMDETRVRAIVEEALAGVAPRAIQVISAAGSVTLEERTNPVFERILKLVAAGENVLIVGPAGCGKTHLVEQVAKALGRRFGMLSGSAGASESQIMGWLLPSDGGKFAYQPSEFIELYEGGNSIFLFDEYDAFDGNMLLCANSALANGHITVPQRIGNQRVNRGENVGIVATANTYGTGADPIYSGRNQLDGATLDRFIVVEMTYDAALEKDMAKAAGLNDSQIERFHTLRAKVEKAGLLRVISTRALKKTISNMLCGMEFGQALQDLTTGWSADEKQRVGF